MKYCKDCGNSVEKNSKFCTECGVSLSQGTISETKKVINEELVSNDSENIALISKSEKAIKNAGASTAAIGWVGLYLLPLLSLIYVFLANSDPYTQLVVLAIGTPISLIVIYLGTYISDIYRESIVPALWLVIVLMLCAYFSLIPLIVAVYAIIALFSVKKLRKLTDFPKKVKTTKPTKISSKGITSLIIGIILVVITSLICVNQRTNYIESSNIASSSSTFSRVDYMSSCTQLFIDGDQLNPSQANQYCGCVYDKGTATLGLNEFSKQAVVDDLDNVSYPINKIYTQCAESIQ